MNNKGFTLIELIAIILILAAIFMVSFPNLLNSAKTNKNKDYDVMVENICLAGETYITIHIVDYPNRSVVGSNISVDLNKLIYDGYVKENEINPKTGKTLKDTTLVYTVLNDLSLACAYDY